MLLDFYQSVFSSENVRSFYVSSHGPSMLFVTSGTGFSSTFSQTWLPTGITVEHGKITMPGPQHQRF